MAWGEVSWRWESFFGVRGKSNYRKWRGGVGRKKFRDRPALRESVNQSGQDKVRSQVLARANAAA